MRQPSREGDLRPSAGPYSRRMNHPDHTREDHREPITFAAQLEAAFADGQRPTSISTALGLLPVEYAIDAEFGSWYAWIQLDLPPGFLGRSSTTRGGRSPVCGSTWRSSAGRRADRATDQPVQPGSATCRPLISGQQQARGASIAALDAA